MSRFVAVWVRGDVVYWSATETAGGGQTIEPLGIDSAEALGQTRLIQPPAPVVIVPGGPLAPATPAALTYVYTTDSLGRVTVWTASGEYIAAFNINVDEALKHWDGSTIALSHEMNYCLLPGDPIIKASLPDFDVIGEIENDHVISRMDLGPDGDVYAYDAIEGEFLRWDNQGNFHEWNANPPGTVGGLVAQGQRVYVAIQPSGTQSGEFIYEYDRQGNYVTKWGVREYTGAISGGLKEIGPFGMLPPLDIAVEMPDLYLSFADEDNQFFTGVMKWHDKKRERAWGRDPGFGPQRFAAYYFSAPVSLALGGEGVYVIDENVFTVHIYSRHGEFIDNFGKLTDLEGTFEAFDMEEGAFSPDSSLVVRTRGKDQSLASQRQPPGIVPA